MAIEHTAGGTVITGPDHVGFYRLLVLKGRLGAEIHGLKFRGRTTASILRHELGFKGSRVKILEQLSAHIEKRRFELGITYKAD